jgi:hypothetical protein
MADIAMDTADVMPIHMADPRHAPLGDATERRRRLSTLARCWSLTPDLTARFAAQATSAQLQGAVTYRYLRCIWYSRNIC